MFKASKESDVSLLPVNTFLTVGSKDKVLTPLRGQAYYCSETLSKSFGCCML